MSVDDRGDELAELRELKRRVDRLESGSMLENSSITRGRMRFIGGTLRVDSGGRVEIVGTLHVEGTTQFIGPVTISGSLNITGDTAITGEFTLDGPWTINGDGDITGDVDVTGDMTILSGGRIVVSGSTPVHIEPGSGSQAARIRLGTGSQDPRISGGDGTGRIETPDGSSAVTVGQGAVGMYHGVDPESSLPTGIGVTLSSLGISMRGLESLPAGTTGAKYVVEHNGVLYTSAGVGGGGGDPTPGEDLGNFQWPFSLSTVTSEYGPRTTPYTGFHEGIDFGSSPAVAGAPIIAAGDGTVAVSTFASGWGNHVRITHNVGGQSLSTLYAHMNATPLVGVGDSVSKGDVIGYVGNTGNSFGAHLHFETWMGTAYGTHVNPRAFMAAYGPE